MINVSSSEINRMEKIGTGTFGNVYLKDNKVYKVYHEKIKAYNKMFGVKCLIYNPCLRCKRIKYNYLKSINYKLQYTELIDDILYIDGLFSGVVMPYYDGDLLKDYVENPIEKKVYISKQLLRNAKELNKNYIYPLDYKGNNIVVDDNNIQIIDLDDEMTKVLNPMYKTKSIKSLDATIKRFIEGVDHNLENKYIQENIIKEETSNNTYKEIYKYLNDILKKNNYIIIDSNTNIKQHINILRNPNYRIIYLYESNEDILEQLLNLKKLDIAVYNIIPKNKLMRFLSSIAYEELLTIKENNIVKVKQLL